MRARHLLIQGRVHRVGYRDWMVQEATRLGLHGWVRNLIGGAVEAVIAGDEDALEALLSACRRGPPLARVDAIEERFCEPPTRPGFYRIS